MNIQLSQFEDLSSVRSVEVAKIAFFNTYPGFTSSGIVSLKKKINNKYLNFLSDNLVEPPLDLKREHERLSFGHQILDTFQLKEFYSLKKGQYRIRIDRFIYYRGKQYTISSKWTDFKLLTLVHH